ncbi:MAG TPA: superoxide dismutase family protein [Candidatus Polarisedimenticolaceae bacterium]|nr:superoxide dismutase family protein [Candidatus Polarisedimenticolaceae bacterium]
MRTTAKGLSMGLAAALAVAVPGAAAAKGAKAEAVLESKSGSSATGKVTFAQHDGKVVMKVSVRGLTPGSHAIHIHEKGDCSAADASSAGGHWNPTSAAHGAWAHPPFHHGDIGNLVASESGKAKLTLETDLWTLGDGKPTDVVGHAVVVHANVDDFITQPTGNAGGRVACGVVQADR